MAVTKRDAKVALATGVIFGAATLILIQVNKKIEAKK